MFLGNAITQLDPSFEAYCVVKIVASGSLIILLRLTEDGRTCKDLCLQKICKPLAVY